MLRQKITMGDKSLEQTSYYTENYVVSQILDKTTLYIAAENRQYVVNTAQKNLKSIDLSQQMMQVNQLKVAVGELQVTEESEENARKLFISNQAENIQIKAEIQIRSYPPLAQTCNQPYQDFSNSLQIFSVALQPDEYIARSHVELSFNNQTNITDIETFEIKDAHEKIPELDAYLKYKKL